MVMTTMVRPGLAVTAGVRVVFGDDSGVRGGTEVGVAGWMALGICLAQILRWF